MTKAMDRRAFLRQAGLFGGLAVVAPSLLSACGGGSGGSAGATTASGELGDFLASEGEQYAGETLNISAINSVQSDAIKSLLGQFEDATGIKVNMTSLAENAQITKISVTLDARSDAFDLYQIQNVFVPQYEANDWFVPVQELMGSGTHEGFSLDNYAPSSITQLTTADKLVAMPMFLATQVVYYRTDLFEKAGIDVLPETFDELQEVCEKLRSADENVAPIALRGAIGPTMNLYSWGAWLYGFGGNYFKKFDAPTNTYSGPSLSSLESVASVEAYARFIQDYAPPGASAWAVSDITKAFLGGQIAMMQEGSPFAGAVNDPATSAVAGNVGVFPVPAGPDGQWPPIGAQGWAIPRASQKQGAAWLFSQWATHPDTLLAAATESQFSAPPTPETIAEQEFAETFDLPGFLEALTPAYEQEESSPIGGAFTPTLLNWQAAGTEVSTLLNAVISGQQDAQAAMTQADGVLAQYI